MLVYLLPDCNQISVNNEHHTEPQILPPVMKAVPAQSAKYIGITITDDMDWGQHISEISSKETKTLGFLRRNLAFAPRSTKEVAYNSLVRPKLEYVAHIWSPYSNTRYR